MTERERIRIRENYRKAKLVYDEWIKCYPLDVEDLDGEEWHEAKNGGGVYHISNFGRLKSFKRQTPRIIKPTINTSGYLSVHMSVDGKKTTPLNHILVGEAFIPNPNDLPELNHKDGIKLNCHVSNLEWTTRHGNLQHAVENGLNKKFFGADNHSAKLTPEQVLEILRLYKRRDKNSCIRALAQKFGVCQNSISSILHGKTYKNVPRDVDKSAEKS